MPIYNDNWCLEEVSKSIVSLDYPKKLLRIVFVDCYSNDGTWETLLRFKKEYEKSYESIILVRDPKKGVGYGRNVCLKHAKSWIFWADSDVILPSSVLKHLLSHFSRDPQVGWARCAWTRKNGSLFERVHMSRIPNTFRQVDSTEFTSSLIRPEAMKVFGYCYEDGGSPFDNFEAAAQYVKLRKAGWKIVNDGSLSDKCLHLCPKNGHWGSFYDTSIKSEHTRYYQLLKRFFRMAKYYLIDPPQRPVHEMIVAGDVKLASKMIYWFILPYIIAYAILSSQIFFLLYPATSFICYMYETSGWKMKLITPFFQICRWVLIAHGYAFFLSKKIFQKLM